MAKVEIITEFILLSVDGAMHEDRNIFKLTPMVSSGTTEEVDTADQQESDLAEKDSIMEMNDSAEPATNA